MNLEELKRPLDEIAESLEFQLARNLDLPTRVALAANQSRIESALAALPAILAKLEAAQRLRLCIKAWIESVPEYSQLAKNLEEALAAFDKEQQ